MKPYHKGARMNQKGGVSALCFKKPRAINLSQASWTTKDEAVTCKKCLAILGAQSLNCLSRSIEHLAAVGKVIQQINKPP
jgi:hypothetical protein